MGTHEPDFYHNEAMSWPLNTGGQLFEVKKLIQN